jgi:hypothetical protein
VASAVVRCDFHEKGATARDARYEVMRIQAIADVFSLP